MDVKNQNNRADIATLSNASQNVIMRQTLTKQIPNLFLRSIGRPNSILCEGQSVSEAQGTSESDSVWEAKRLCIP